MIKGFYFTLNRISFPTVFSSICIRTHFICNNLPYHLSLHFFCIIILEHYSSIRYTGMKQKNVTIETRTRISYHFSSMLNTDYLSIFIRIQIQVHIIITILNCIEILFQSHVFFYDEILDFVSNLIWITMNNRT